MASTGAVFPTSGTSTAESPWLDNAWTTPEEVVSDNDIYANVTAGTFDASDRTEVLKASGFDFSAIPDGATIGGVTARVEARGDSTSVLIDLAQLLDTSGAKVGTNLAAGDIPLTATDAVYMIGGTADLWGNALDDTWVKNPQFGIALGARADAANSQVFIDYVTLEIEYTSAEPPPPPEPSGPPPLVTISPLRIR